ncbi:MAG: inositol monophosphatase [Magnetococcales bacterium]|nr:inositol monophosphatase [Magnetococcales bacterium]
MNHSPFLNVMTNAAYRAGRKARNLFENRHRLEIIEKGPNDFVSSADVEVEQEIIYHLKKAHPTFGIKAEEGGNYGKDKPHNWIIDPIDGTSNFLQGIPHFALSVALTYEEEVIAGVVYNPIMDEIFTAERGRGAFCNKHRIRVSQTGLLKEAILGTGFPHRNKKLLSPYMKSFESLFTECRGVRRAGSAALDLAYVAAGRFDGFWEMRLSPWDIAAGVILVHEAGGYMTDFIGEKKHMQNGNVVAANPKMHRILLDHMRDSGLDQY